MNEKKCLLIERENRSLLYNTHSSPLSNGDTGRGEREEERGRESLTQWRRKGCSNESEGKGEENREREERRKERRDEKGRREEGRERLGEGSIHLSLSLCKKRLKK